MAALPLNYAFLFFVCFFTLGPAWMVDSSLPDVLHYRDKLVDLHPHQSKKLEAVHFKPTSVFIVFQAHSQFSNITMSYEVSLGRTHVPVGQYVAGTNIGLVRKVKKSEEEVYVWLYNPNSVSVRVAIIVSHHKETDPLPGGCNLEFPTEIAPYLRLSGNYISSMVEFQHASLYKHQSDQQITCDQSSQVIKYDAYVYYLPDSDHSESEYFTALRLMSQVSDIETYGSKVRTYLFRPLTKFLALSYPNHGVVYNIIATYNGSSTAYVPVAGYHTDCRSNANCHTLTTVLTVLITLASGLFGLFICVRGHTNFCIQTIYFGFISGALISFILAARLIQLSPIDAYAVSVLSGILGATVWLSLYLIFKCKLFSATLGGIILGFLITASILFSQIGNNALLRNDLNYWCLVGCGILMTPILLLPFGVLLSVFSCSIVGSYTVVATFDYYLGGSLPYIVLNVLKRGAYEEVYMASNQVPFQTSDVVLICVWAVLTIFGAYLQLRKELEFEFADEQVNTRRLAPRSRGSRKDNYNNRRTGYIVFVPPISSRNPPENEPLLAEGSSRIVYLPRYDAIG